MKSLFKCLRTGYVRFVEKQGFPIIVTVCVAVITLTAVWTDQQEDGYVSPTPPVGDNVSAAQLLQQTLRDAATSTPAPIIAPKTWTAPLDEINVLRPFSLNEMYQSSMSGIWMIHDAVDLTCKRGDKVYAIGDGTVTAHGDDQLLGVWILIDHGDDIQALYAGLAVNNAYITGDAVRTGAVIGFAGNGILDESDLGPHLHLRVTRDGAAINPLNLLDKTE